MKKIPVILICLALIACGLTQGLKTKRIAVEDEMPIETISFKTTRNIPETADFGKYLAGYIAKANQDFPALNLYYQQVFEADPENMPVLEQLYLSHVLLGHFDELLPLIPHMDESMKQRLYTPNILVADDFRQKNYAAALQKIKKIPDNSIQTVLNPVLTAWAYAGQGDSKKAVNALKTLYKYDELKSLGLYNEMMISMYFEKMDVAQNIAQVLLKDKKITPAVMSGVRQLYEKLGKWTPKNPFYAQYNQMVKEKQLFLKMSESDSFFESVDTPQKGVAQIFNEVAVSLGGREDGAETAVLFNSIARSLNGDSQIIRAVQAELLESIQFYAEANKVYDTVSNPTDVVLFKKALNLIQMNQLDEAEKILTPLSQKNLGNPLIHGMLASLYQDTNRFDLAISYYTLTIDLLKQINDDKALANAYYARAQAHERINKNDLFESDLLRSIALDSSNPNTLNNLGYAWLEQDKNITQAIEYIEKAHALVPTDPHVLDSLAWGYYKKKDYQKAIALAEQVSDMLPGNAVVADHLGDIYMALGRYREAGYQYKKALDLSSDLTAKQRSMVEKKQKNVLKSK